MTEPFDFKNPDYAPVYRSRIEALKRLRAEPQHLPVIKRYYKQNPAQFITDWGATFDPRAVELGRSSAVPFVLFPKQEEWVKWTVDLWHGQKGGLTEKSRDMGISWLAIATACTLCLFNEGMVVGFGSRLEDYVDKIGNPASLFWKARFFIENLPLEFRNGWDPKNDAPHMRIKFPATNSFMIGEAGDNIGRGNRTGIYFVDEAAHLEHPESVDAALSATTNCRQDLSTPCGANNPFAYKRHSGKVPVFTFHWRDDPRKDDAWYAAKIDELNNPIVVAQEIDIDYSASVEGILIPSAWVQAAIDAHVVLKVKPQGAKFGALDVADEGGDLCAFCGAHGILVEHMSEWSGAGSDIHKTTLKVFDLCDQLGYEKFYYDADGLGAGVRGDARVINETRKTTRRPLGVEAFRGSGAVHNPDASDVKGRTNGDMFLNAKAQSWWHLRTLFYNTWRAVTEGAAFDPDRIISIAKDLPLRAKLVNELSQPTYSLNNAGKHVIDKKPDGARSPNLADALMIRYSRGGRPLKISSSLLNRSRFAR